MVADGLSFKQLSQGTADILILPLVHCKSFANGICSTNNATTHKQPLHFLAMGHSGTCTRCWYASVNMSQDVMKSWLCCSEAK